MLDRGLRRRFDPAVERAAREAAASRAARDTGARRDLTRAADLHDRPADGARLRRRDLGRAARRTARSGSGSTSPTSPRTCRPGSAGRPRGATAARTSVYVPGAVEPMLPEALSNDACSLRAGRGPARGHRRAGLRRRATCGAPPSTARAIRSDARLDYPRVDRIFAGARARRGAVGGAARGRARGAPRRSSAARRRGRARGRVGRAASSPSTARAT